MTDEFLPYHRARFKTRLPTDRLFTESHFWLAPAARGTFRVGFTRFATRMLGDIVEVEFEASPDTEVGRGETIGWVEGFKAVTDLYAPMGGRFVAVNADLDAVLGEIHRAPYHRGWLYEIEGSAPDDGMDAASYAAFLDRTIDRMTGRGS